MSSRRLENISFIILLNILMIFSVSAQNIVDENGKKQGKWVKYKNSIKFYEGQFLDGVPIGEFKYFYPNGHIKIQTKFADNGRINRTKIFFDSYEATRRINKENQPEEAVFSKWLETSFFPELLKNSETILIREKIVLGIIIMMPEI